MAQATVTFPDDLQPVLERALKEHGEGVLDALVTNWLLDRQRYQREADMRQNYEAFKALPADRQDAITAELAAVAVASKMKSAA